MHVVIQEGGVVLTHVRKDGMKPGTLPVKITIQIIW
jgi:hypothetical protein